nr:MULTISPECIES: hypothetical protein [unclassified Nocardiopsis]
MGTTRPDPPGTAPLPVTGPAPGEGSRARVLADLHGQSYGKDVAEVRTLFFGPRLSTGLARPVPGQVRPPLPALGPLRDLDAAGPALGGTWTRAQRLLAACVEAVRIRRVSAADRYPVHRAYPSPRGLFGADLFLVADGPAPRCLRVDPGTHALQPRDGVPAPADPEELSGFRLVVAVDHRRYPPEYGRLRPSLALLEGGHLLATLGLALERAGLRPRTRFGAADAPDGYAPCGVITLDPDGPDAPAVPAEALARVAAACAPAGVTLRRWLDERGSGVSAANLVTSAYVSPEEGAVVTAALTAALGAAREAVPGPGALRLYRQVLVADRVEDRAARELSPDGTEHPDRPVERTGETNFSSPLGYTLTADFTAWARAHGDRAPAVLHTLLGWIAQWGCLGAAATGLCARPMRNHQEADWAAVLGLDPGQTPAYQLWVRAERGSYLDLPVDA